MDRHGFVHGQQQRRGGRLLSRHLEPHDELGLPWDGWADGRVYCLERGRDFYRPTHFVREAAENAARRLGGAVAIVPESRLGRTYLWVQFVDGEVPAAGPCVCGSDRLRAVNPQLAFCPTCRRTLMLQRPRRSEAGDETGAPQEGEAVVLSLLSGSTGDPMRRAKEAARLAKVEAAGAKAFTVDDLHMLGEESNQRVGRAELRAWRRRAFNEYAAIVEAGVGPLPGDGPRELDAAADIELHMTVEIFVKQLDVLPVVVLQEEGTPASYRILREESVRLAGPAAHCFVVRVPAGTLEGGRYSVRVAAALIAKEEFSRITKRNAFEIEVASAAEASAVKPRTVEALRLALDWTVTEAQS